MDQSKAGQEDLQRGLHNRHIQLIALGGAIGVGLFLGSASAIKTAGPSLILSYILGGLVVFFVLRALGEIAVKIPVSGSFSTYASLFVGPKAGFITGWTYWYVWLVTCMAEITAVGLFMKFWYPEIDQWIPALASLVCITLVNFITVKAYGEFEFWFALIKIVTIVAMLVLGTAMIMFGIGNAGVAVGISNLWTHGGFFPMGLTGFLLSLVMVAFSYNGIEIIGITAGEAQDPENSLSSAIDKVFWRILIFYAGSMFVVLSIYPWNEIGSIGSPFVALFDKLGIRGAASIVNFVVMTSALSSCNSGIYTCGRMLYSSALRKEAPSVFAKLSKNQVPVNGILATAAFALIGVILNYVAPGEAFSYVASVTVTGCLWSWMIIMIIQMKHRKSLSPDEVANLKFPMPFYPFGNYFVLTFLAALVISLAMDPDKRIALVVGAAWYAMLFVAYKVFNIHKESPESVNETKQI